MAWGKGSRPEVGCGFPARVGPRGDGRLLCDSVASPVPFQGDGGERRRRCWHGPLAQGSHSVNSVAGRGLSAPWG